MGMTRRKFVNTYYKELAENPRKYLRGHGLKQNAWKILTEEVGAGKMFMELLNVAYSLKKAVKGPAALRKADNFAIKYYKTQGTLFDNFPDDVEEFIAGLPKEDQEKFTNKDNVYVIGYFKGYMDKNPVQSLKLDNLLANKYKALGRGQFLVIFIGDSAVRTGELTIAKTQARKNARRVQKEKSPAKIKAKLRKRYKNKLNKINKKIARLSGQSELLSSELQEFNTLAAEMGIDTQNFDYGDITKKLKNADRSKQRLIKKMTPTEQGIWSLIQKMMKTDPRGAKKLVTAAKSKTISALYNKEISDSNSIIDSKAAPIRKKIAQLNKGIKTAEAKIASLTETMEAAKEDGDLNKARAAARHISSVKNRIKRYKAQLRQLKAKSGVYRSLKKGTKLSLAEKRKMLDEIQAEIEDLKAQGASERQALQVALSKVPVPQEVAQVATQNVQAGMTAQVAMQDAAQQAVTQQVQQVTNQQFNDGDDDDDLADIVEEWL